MLTIIESSTRICDNVLNLESKDQKDSISEEGNNTQHEGNQHERSKSEQHGQGASEPGLSRGNRLTPEKCVRGQGWCRGGQCQKGTREKEGKK